MSETVADVTFNYFISSNQPFGVVTFVGEMNKDSLEKLQQCQVQMEKLYVKYVILYFRDVTLITSDVIPFLTGLQQQARKKSELRLCSLRPDIKERLIKMGVVRGLELTDNLQQTLLQLKEGR